MPGSASTVRVYLISTLKIEGKSRKEKILRKKNKKVTKSAGKWSRRYEMRNITQRDDEDMFFRQKTQHRTDYNR